MNIVWEDELYNGIIELSAYTEQDRLFPYLWEGSPYYISGYVCPECQKIDKMFFMYKLRVRNAKTMFKNSQVELFNIFTCPIHKRFYASIYAGDKVSFTNKPLREYALVSKKYNDKEYDIALSETLLFFNSSK